MKWRRAFLLVWILWIFGSSCTVITQTQWLGTVHQAAPGLASPTQLASFWDRYWWVFVKGYHVLEFAVLYVLVRSAYQVLGRRHWIPAVLCLAYAATDEFHQHFVHDRGGRWTDVLIDAGGICLGLILLRAAHVVHTRRYVRRLRTSLQPIGIIATSE